MTKSGSLPIRDPARQPQNVPVSNSAEEIKKWLEATSPTAVTAAAQTYANAAKAIDTLVNALPGLAGQLAGVWTSDSSPTAQRALQMLHATGAELSFKMQLLSTALKTYGEVHLPEARRKISQVEMPEKDAPPPPAKSESPVVTTTPKPPSSAPPTSTSTPKPEPGRAPKPPDDPAARNREAQQILQTLNGQIVTLWTTDVPVAVEYELPEVSLPGDLGGGRPYTLPTGGPYQSIFGEDGPGSRNDPGGGHNLPGGGDNGGRPGNPGDNKPGGPDATNPDKPGGPDDKPGGDQPGGDQPGGDQPGGEKPGDGTQQPPAPGGQRPGDGTAPPVIGAENPTTTTPDVRDPRATETSSVPPTITTPTMTTPTTTPFTPTVTTPAPTTGLPPGTPAVIGGSGAMGGQGTPAGGLAARSNAMGMMPFMPLGGAAGPEGEDHERTTYLSEDRDAWSAHHEVTTPVID
ncbi:hypothetical protein [Nonomuraea typhae]|uniref:hypothetical protein n=1 Tax=Nonomuraea typhae TaxID=2603600 RepID=UPI0012FBED13|nr:hypothetical protein [Nonomuraea typhae]